MQYSSEILALFGEADLANLCRCEIKELSSFPNYMSTAILNHIFKRRIRDKLLQRLSLYFLRRSYGAAQAYSDGRRNILVYFDGVESGRHDLKEYLWAVHYFEQCINSVRQAADAFKEMQTRVDEKPTKLFEGSDHSDLSRLYKLSNDARHFDAPRATQASVAIWIAPAGIRSGNEYLTFDELHENVVALFDVAHTLFC